MGKGTISWTWEKLGEGTFRVAYPGTVKEGDWAGFTEGQPVVVKVMKSDMYNNGYRLSDKDIHAQQLASQYAQRFNEEVQPQRDGHTCNVHVRVGAILEATSPKKKDGKVLIANGDKMAVELRISGKYEKFNSNTGWSADVCQLMDFFSHWTYKHSGQKYLVCDLQGHRGVPGSPTYRGESNYYLLTDPAILSHDGRFGDSDLGLQGIRNFFGQHKCNALCKKHGLDKVKPGQILKKSCLKRTSLRNCFK